MMKKVTIGTQVYSPSQEVVVKDLKIVVLTNHKIQRMRVEVHYVYEFMEACYQLDLYFGTLLPSGVLLKGRMVC